MFFGPKVKNCQIYEDQIYTNVLNIKKVSKVLKLHSALFHVSTNKH